MAYTLPTLQWGSNGNLLINNNKYQTSSGRWSSDGGDA